MKKASLSLVGLFAAILIPLALSSCDDSSGSSGGTPAAGLNVTGFWENPLNGATAAGDLAQTNGTVTGSLLLPPNSIAPLSGVLDGYHMTFTMTYDNGTTESGEGDFSFVTGSETDKLVFNGNLASTGNFQISWRGPSFDQHDPAGAPLTYTPAAPTW